MRKITGDVAATARALQAMPKTVDVQKRFKHRLKVRKDGKWSVDLTDRRDRLAYAEMLEPANAIAGENARRMQAQIPQVEVTDRRGIRRLIPAENEEAFDRNGFRRAVRRSNHLEKWSDGLLYRETPGGGMECTNKCCLGRPYVPCGNPRCEWCGDGESA